MANVPPTSPTTAPDTAEPPNNKAPPAPPKVPKTEVWSTRTWFRLYLNQMDKDALVFCLVLFCFFISREKFFWKQKDGMSFLQILLIDESKLEISVHSTDQIEFNILQFWNSHMNWNFICLFSIRPLYLSQVTNTFSTTEFKTIT